ncbi:MAG: FG-GAP-like repeat-containing protein, partial [Prevotellaceae bacterium]|nr:FG-GAP-like repeat-containing protein [Prevotellaceae bacterium]
MKKKLLLLSILFFSVISLSHAALVVDMGNSTKTGAYYTFPNLTVTGNAGDKGYVIRFMFTRTVETGDAISLPTMPSSNWTENAVSTEYVRMIDITGGAIAAELQDFLRSIQITFASTKKGQEVAVLISETSTDTGKNIYYSSDTDHWYEYVSATQILWTNAYNAALDRTFMGLTGYLANITSKEEDDFIFTIASGKYGWFSGTRYDVRTVMQANGKLSGVPTAAFDYWYWSCGPEWDDTKNAAYPNGNPADAVFYNKRTYTSAAAAVTVKYNYTNWHSINPSNSGGGEYCIQAIPDEGGTWNDWPNYYASITGYIVEYRGTLIAANAMGIVGFGSVKNASINGVTDNGTSVSPVSLNFGDVLTYTITAANLSETNTAVIVRDMLPAGLNIVGGSISNGGTYNSTTREIVWNLTIPTENEMNVSFQATKILGVDNVMLNTAYVISDGAVIKQTNYTYHQGILSQTEYPDNIIDADCYIDPTAQAWGIRETKTHNQADVHNLASVYTGDLNGDGYPELITYTSDNNLGIDDGRYAQRMLIYMGPDHSTIKTITAAATSYFPLWVGATALVKTQILGKDTALIISQCYDGKLHAFNVDGAKVWTSQVLTSRLSSSRFFIVGAADFDNDGIPEIYCGHDIFDSRTGTLICTKSTGNFGLSNSGGLANPSGTTGTGTVYERGIVAPIAADVDGDGILEYIAGSEVYKVDLVSGTMTLATSVTPPYDIYNSTVLMPQDGKTQVADIDLDGYLDIIVSGTYTIENVNNYAYVWVWSPVKNKVLARTNVAYARNQSYPFIGDIDGDGYPEILFITSLQRTNATWAGYDYMWAFKYDGTDTLFEFWKLAHSDRSGNTGITLFDFNQDGISEIVFRDESHLRIINGSLIHHQSGAPVAEPYNLAAYTCYSATGAEYPIVADIDNDGMAEIIATGHPSNSTFPFASAPLRIFRADVGTSWAPARKVWNQYAYNAVNINEDLTIPIYQLNPATVFPGNDGQLGTSDDVRPYNAFLQQQTALNKNGTPLWLVPNAQLDTPDPAFTYHADGDSLYIELKIKNIGNAALQAPVKITVHKDVVPAPAAARYTYQYPQSILQGASAEVKFAIPNYSSWIGAVDNDTKLILKINDNGKGYNDQPVCDSVNIKYEQALNALVFAKNDSIEYIQGIRPFDLIDVLTNDVIPAACTGLNPVVVNVAKGSA